MIRFINIVNKISNIKAVNVLLISFCFFVVYFPPFAKNVILQPCLNNIRVFGLLLIIILYLFKLFNDKKISNLVLGTSVFVIYLFIVSFINKSASTIIYTYQIVNLLCAVIINDLFSIKDKRNLYYMSIFVILSIYLLVEIFFYIYYAFILDEAYPFIIFSNRNVMFVFLIPVFVLYNYFINSKYKYIYCFIVIISILFNVINHSLITSVALSSFLFYSIYITNTKKIYNFQTSYIILVILVLFIFINYVYLGTNSLFVKYIDRLSIFVHKLHSLYDRAEIYDYVREYYSGSSIFGMGYKYYYDGAEVFSRGFHLTHSTMFDILIWGGGVGLILFFMIQYIVVDNVKNNNNYKAFVLFAIFIITLRDMFESTSLYFILFNYGLLYYFDEGCKSIDLRLMNIKHI